jgi:hypothetical protein
MRVFFVNTGCKTGAGKLRRFSNLASLYSLFILFSNNVAMSQNFARVITGVPVERNGEALTFPFFGGLDRFLPQFVDVDGDADLDLFLSEPEGNLVLFENIGTAHDPQFHLKSDRYDTLNVRSWFYFVDIDADGDPDLYHANGNAGLAFRRNTGSKAQAKLELESTSVLTSDNNQPVFSEFTSIPAFTDIDADRDFDFFTGLSTGTIVWYQNTGSSQQPAFDLATDRWQDLLIFTFGKMSSSPSASGTSGAPAHGANGIDFVDFDADVDNDFFYGDLFHKGLYYLRNDGTPQAPVVAITDTLFPRAQPIITEGYNVPRFADLDADGKHEIFLACLNQNANNFLSYKQAGTDATPAVQLATANFLSMIDVGSYCAPALADLDADGDQDLLMGNVDGQLVFYENTGTATTPSFRWISDNFQSMRISEYAATPVFADVDGDGDFDFFSGSFLGKIAFYENRGSPQFPDFVLITAEFESIDVGNASAPHFADVDDDGDVDLFIGEQNRGVINMFENIGNANTPRFVFKREIRHDFNVEDAIPFLHDWDGDGRLDLFIGQRNGTIIYYRGVTADSFAFVQKEFAGIDVGFSCAPAFAELDGDGHIDLIAGEQAGGVNFFRGTERTGVADRHSAPPSTFELSAHPNPFRGDLNIVVRTDQATQDKVEPPRVTIYNLLGARLAELKMRNAGHGLWRVDWQPTNLVSGVYFLRVGWGEHHITRKILRVP